jgi:hypothetical protein
MLFYGEFDSSGHVERGNTGIFNKYGTYWLKKNYKWDK